MEVVGGEGLAGRTNVPWVDLLTSMVVSPPP